MSLWEDLTAGQIKQVKRNLNFADEILKVELTDPSHGGYVETLEREKIKVTYIYQGKKQVSYFNAVGIKVYNKY